MKNDDLIREHYRAQAEKDRDSSLSTIGERVVREKEVELIKNFLSLVLEESSSDHPRILDAGCGNGYTLSQLIGCFPSWCFHGLEFTEELLSVAQDRNLKGCMLDQGDIRLTEYQDSFFDIVYTERCLINILDWEQQKQAMKEIARILKHSGYYLMIECFTDGLENNNKARREMGLSEIEPAYHNLYFDKERLFSELKDVFRVVDPIVVIQVVVGVAGLIGLVVQTAAPVGVLLGGVGLVVPLVGDVAIQVADIRGQIGKSEISVQGQ